MQKTLKGKIISLKMQKTAVVEVVRKSPHPMYRKLIKISRKFKADTGSLSLNVGDKVKIGEVRPISKDKKFKILEKLK
ncbi:MAG: 30S ribosomal protein S17 [Candidatus Levybacteria bacterium RBG_16_35_11]|nr:MAG: 30S ribosomal protein S17 [Candidatus Levybacteria bacterium RBG_16_35_11]